MHVSKDQTIAGVPAVLLRDTFRSLRDSAFSPGHLGECLNLEPRQGAHTVQGLLVEGYLEAALQASTFYHTDADTDRTYLALLGWHDHLDADGRAHLWLTTRGLALAGASAAKRVKRATAERALTGLLERVVVVNADSDLVYLVKTVVLFGSFLDPMAATLGDVDVAVELVERAVPEGVSRSDFRAARVEVAYAAGRRFGSFFDEVAWPEEEVLRRLKGGSRVLSLHDLAEHRQFLEHVPQKVIFASEVASGECS